MGERLQGDLFLLPTPFPLPEAGLVVTAVLARVVMMVTVYRELLPLCQVLCRVLSFFVSFHPHNNPRR